MLQFICKYNFSLNVYQRTYWIFSSQLWCVSMISTKKNWARNNNNTYEEREDSVLRLPRDLKFKNQGLRGAYNNIRYNRLIIRFYDIVNIIPLYKTT